MTESTADKVIPSKVTDVNWVYSSPDCPGAQDGSQSNNSTAGESMPTQLVQPDAGTEERKPTEDKPKSDEDSKTTLKANGVPDGDTGLSAVVEDLQKLCCMTEEVYTGKWMLFFDQLEEDEDGCTGHDRAWFKIRQLCLDGRLDHAKASTAVKDPKAHTVNLGCICCYTLDYRDQEEFGKKADLIRSALEEELSEKVIYYKTESATLANQYRVLGCGRVSMYRHKPDYSFWKTSEDNKSWDILRRDKRKGIFRPRPNEGWRRNFDR